MRSPRAAARREVTKRLVALKKDIIKLQAWWTPTSTVLLTNRERKPGDNAWFRQRQLHEYPEMQRAYWAGTIGELDAMAERIAELREHCIREYKATPAEDQEPVRSQP